MRIESETGEVQLQQASQESEAGAAQVPVDAGDNTTPGQLVRKRREAAGLALPEVAESLHLTVHYVKALENDDYAKLPGLTFVKGYFRAYARHLGMNVDALMGTYEAYLQEREDLVAQQDQDFRIRRRNDQAVVWALVAGAVLVAGLVAGWWWFGRDTAAGTALVMAAAQVIG